MRPYSVNFELKRFLTFAFVIGIQFQILGMLALELSTHDFSTVPSGVLLENNILPMINLTTKSNMLTTTKPATTTTKPITTITTSRTITTTIAEEKQIIKHKSVSSKRSLPIPITPISIVAKTTTITTTPIILTTPILAPVTTALASASLSSSILTTTKEPISSTTVVNKSNSKFSLDSVLSKNHWTKAGEMTEKPKSLQTQTFRNKHHHEHHWGPFFEEPLNPNEGDQMQSAAHLYTEAVLNCRVGMLRDKTVMWVRRTTEKVSLLTVGNVTYSGDPRIRVKFQYPNNWRLLINPAQKEDAGLYMCQVSTHPPRVFATNLTILEPPLRLIDDQEHEVTDRYYKAGSTIDLKCQVSRSFLLKEKRTIVSDNRTKLISTINELNSTDIKQMEFEQQFKDIILWAKDDEQLPKATLKRTSKTDKWISSRITIPDARMLDGGNYSCSIAKLFKAIVQVQVLTGELPAAVQHNSSEYLKLSKIISIIFLLSVLIAILQTLVHGNPSMMDISPLSIFNLNYVFS